MMVDIALPGAISVAVSNDTISVELSDGRTIAVPLSWYPRLLHATQKERKNWRLIGNGSGIHWEDIDEDISVIGIVSGRPSQESQASLKNGLLKNTILNADAGF